MNILFHCSEYPPMPSGGIGSVVRIIAEGLVKRGHTVVVAGYYPDLPAFYSYEVQNGVHVYNCSIERNLPHIIKYLCPVLNALHLLGKSTQRSLDYYENMIATLIRRYEIELIEMTDFYEFNFCKSTLKFHKFDIPVVMRFHGSTFFLISNAGKNNSFARKNDLAHFARANYFSYASSYIRSFVRNIGGEYPPEREIVIHNMIEDDFLCRNIQTSNSRTILYFGKLIKTKGAFATIKAFCSFHKTHPDWKLVMAGPGDPKAILTDVAKDIRCDIKFPGVCSRKKIMQYIDDCAFVCLPSFFETFSMAPIETMARSRAVIYTNRTSGPEIINDGENGILVDPDNISMIAEKMSLLADNINLRNRIAENAFKKIEADLSENHIIERLENFYQKLT